jgi:tRNA (guanine-N7-)-methyltransferase
LNLASDSDFGVPIPGRVLPPEQWAKTAIKRLPPPGPLDWPALFGRIAPVVLDLGCGNGRFVITSALARPQLDHLGVDILPLVLRYATRRANQRGLANVRLAAIGGYELLEQYIGPASVAEIHLYHPQPYKETSQQHRRLITPEFLAIVYRCLSPGGLVVLQTDNRAYWQYIRRAAPLLFDFEEVTEPWPDAPQGRTRREIYARQHKLTIYRGQGRPKPQLAPERIMEIVRTHPAPDFDARQ